MLRGVQPSHILHLFRGTWHGGLFNYREHRIAPYSVPIATQTLHAVGFATGAKIDGANTVVITCFGDGATSVEADGKQNRVENNAYVLRGIEGKEITIGSPGASATIDIGD